MAPVLEIDATGNAERPTVVVRPAVRADQESFLIQWRAYLEESHLDVSDAITEMTWARIIDPQSRVGALVASAEAGRVVGFALYVLHPVALALHPDCHLDHVFVEAPCRGFGIDRNLILSLGDLARDERWRSVYWQAKTTDISNTLFEELAEATPMVLYRLMHE